MWMAIVGPPIDRSDNPRNGETNRSWDEHLEFPWGLEGVSSQHGSTLIYHTSYGKKMKQYEILHCNGLVVFSTKPTLVLKEAADFMFSMKQPWLFLCKPAVPGLEVPEPGNTPPVCLLFTTLSSYLPIWVAWTCLYTTLLMYQIDLGWVAARHSIRQAV